MVANLTLALVLRRLGAVKREAEEDGDEYLGKSHMNP